MNADQAENNEPEEAFPRNREKCGASEPILITMTRDDRKFAQKFARDKINRACQKADAFKQTIKLIKR
jgi:hypothetical protein